MAFRRIALSTAAMSSVSILRLLAQLFVVPILSRLLSPADYGVVAMAMPLVLFTMIFTDVGVGQSLVRTSQTEEGVWSTSFWLTMCSGSLLALGIAALGPAAALFYHEPRLTPIVVALALVIIPQAGATIPEASLRQSKRFGTIAATEISAVLCGVALAVTVALEGGGAWALVAQQLTLYGMRFVLTFWFSSFRPRFHFHLKSISDHLLFGRNVLTANFMWFLTASIDGMIVGRVLGATALGLYSMAFQFARLPVLLISGPLQYVIYTHLAPLRDDKDTLRRIFLLFTRVLGIIIFPAVGMVAAAHHAVFKIFLSEKWLESGTLFMLAAPAASVQAVTAMRGTLTMVLGRTEIQLRCSIEFFFVLGALLLTFIWFGMNWFVVGYNLAVFLYLPRALMLILPLVDCPMPDYFRVMAVPAGVTAGCILVYWLLLQAAAMGDWTQLFLGGGISVAGIALSALIQRRALTDAAALLRENW